MQTKFGNKQLNLWTRSYEIGPPVITKEVWAESYKGRQYKGMLKETLPYTESLKDCARRVKPLWVDSIAWNMLDGKTPIICAHGNSLRALIKIISDISNEGSLLYRSD